MGKICTFFGHRDAPLALESSIEKQVRKLITEENVDTFWIGGYGRFDSLATRVLNKLQKDFPDISIILIIAYAQELQKIDALISEDITKIANEKGYNLILVKGMVISGADDITEYVIEGVR